MHLTFSTHVFDRSYFEAARAAHGHEIIYTEARARLTPRLAEGSPAVCAFVNDDLCASTLAVLHGQGGRRRLSSVRA